MSPVKSRTPMETRVLETFRTYGGQWKLTGMAQWLNISIGQLRKIWDKLEQEGLMEVKRNEAKNVTQ